MKNIIITCGTSILNTKTIEYIDYQQKIWDIENNYQQYDEEFIKYFDENFHSIFNKKEKSDIKYFGAEINLLRKVYQEWDNIYLIFSDTKGWKIVKSILEKYFKSDYAKKHIWNIEIPNSNFITILGFKNNAKEFTKNAIPSFFNELEKIKKNTQYQEVVMCPVWWYKSLIPYASLFAMINGWEIQYLYEDEENLLILPSIPLNLDINLIKDLTLLFSNVSDIKIIDDILKETKSTQSELLSLFPWLLEIDDKMVCLSALWKLYYYKYVELENTKVYLTDNAKKQLKNQSWLQETNFKNILTRLKDSTYRKNKAHHCFNKFVWYKMGNTTERVLFYENPTDQWIEVIICEIVLHPEYDKLLEEENSIIHKNYNWKNLFA